MDGATSEVSEAERPERGSIGKADLLGSCQTPEGGDFCGGPSDGNCWCDEACEDFGDCCEDAGEVCGVGPQECGEVLCALFCEHGFQTDENGCEVCACEPQFCGGIGALPCPEGEVCVLDGAYPDAGGHCEPDPGCAPEDCGPAPLFQQLCPDGETVIDAVCEKQPDLSCGWTIPACPDVPKGTCEGNCGGQADGCWCDEACEDFGDCCGDYGDLCQPEPTACGELECDDGEACVVKVTQLGPEHSCAPIPEECDGEATCDCMGDDVCTGVFNSCGQGEGDELFCSCPVC